VLARDPLHIGANHLAIHAFEESPHPEEALPSADRLASLSFEPAAEHLAHMPAHTYMRVGEYAKAGDANARAVALYDVYLAGDPPGHTNYFGHDCTFGVDAYMMSGEYARARGLAATCARTGSGMIPLVDLRFRRWTVLANDQIASDFVRGMLAAHDGETDVAQTALGKLRTGTSSTVATIQANLVEAELDRQAAKPDAEIAALERAVAAQDTFGYSEPPTFFYPVRESLGAALYRAGRTAEAEQTFRDDLAKNRENPRSLFGLWEILRKEDRAEEASAVRTRFENAWKEADAQLDLQDL